uniref:U2A'/phosphoprotein 32 family A C-terminal domain-containing protein n=1 Tax=Bicosoecida sp. CB-2014 TaxID=1486930 RepID=A0A7S1CI18_9STRA|mmetsp:Transcript_2563/g.8788  ORF Transcript_2563/g.8788 Transcript_2563/m.8788 type:complete len:244 (+) Transcript_2563:149-880(+)
MRLTADLVSRAGTRFNPAREWELELRGLRIPVLENLGATKDQFDCLDLCDNEIQKLENLPVLRRLTTLLLANNRISRVEAGLGEQLPSLRTLVLTNNRIAALSTIDALAGFTKLENLVLLQNAVQRQEHYRLYVIHKLPSLKSLDFARVRLRERKAAAKLFKSSTGKAIEDAVQKASARAKEATGGGGGVEYTEEQLEKIARAVEEAATPEEVDRIERLVSKGEFFSTGAAAGGAGGADADME